MKKLVSIFAMMLIVSSMMGQVLISENFDTYTVGDKLAQTAGAPWTTWSAAPGGTEDPVISATQSSSPANSVYIGATTNDLVLNLSDKTTGRFKIEFNIFVETGKVGYFNMLNDFAGATSIWAMQAYFRPNGYCSVDAGAALVDSLTYNINAWNNIIFIVDVDDDFATMYLNNSELTSWVFSSGSFGTGTTHKLDAMNFFGWSNSGINPGYYIDDMVVTQVTAPNPPLNLAGVLNGNDIDLDWDAPSSGTPDSYTLIRNNAVLASGLTALLYSDPNLYPQTYNYTVKAHYDGLGYSTSSNVATIAIPGGVDRNLVLFEIITGTWCYYCPGAAKGADDMVSNGHDVAVIEYHSGDPYETADITIRNNYYNPAGIPFTGVDGVYKMEGGDHTVSLYPTYLNMYNQRVNVPAVEIIYLDVVPTTWQNYQATVSLKQTNGYFNSGLILYTALTESDIPESWQGMTDLDFVCRAMYPSGNGTALDFSTDDSLTFTFNFSVAGYVKDNCEFVAFVQHDPTEEIVQAGKVEMSTIMGVEDMVQNRIDIYPNPAYDYVRIMAGNEGTVEIFNMAGQVVLSQQIVTEEQMINISDLEKGVYTVMVTTPSGVGTNKLIIN